MTSSRPTRRSLARLGLAALAAVSIAATAGCAGSGDGDSSAKEISIINRWSDPIGKAAAEEMFEAFTAETGITVKNNSQPSSGDTYQPAVRSALSSSNAPSLAVDNAGPNTAEYAKSGAVRDITDFFDETLADRSSAGATSGEMYDGKLYGISAGAVVGNLIWYNPDYLAEFGIDAADITTYEEWMQAMETIKKAGGTPIVLGAKDQWPGGHYLNDFVQRALGSEQTTALYERTVNPDAPDSPKWTDPAVVGAFQDYVDMKPLFQDGFLGEAQATADSLFLSGDVGFYEMGSWYLTAIQNAKPDFEPGVMLFPALEDGAGSGDEVTLGNDSLMVSADADPEAAEAFLEFFTRPDVAAKFGAATSKIMPYEIDESLSTVDDIIAPQWEAINGFATGGEAALFNDQAIDVNIYQTYIWQGSVGLMSGDVTPEELASQLEQATVDAQKANG
ncbi:extracellular solute-binding protein [Herbiconiux sp. KACC 21604]|uniref:ABC transporter substrate-binding protein n=1 Tax=unclassified Herbiconiux TaxID=2618217 RepID=UPI0014926FDB|nr:extracellular solute-binding protein [Herbiconiux sp. SALV-R1]QJU55241.1 extracellular solute-binding protein [Herbiconiux sp. SALV-R1]WPO86407.1 extracellular solute-binding protein [Herbiconiux sp. KACC 21604]